MALELKERHNHVFVFDVEGFLFEAAQGYFHKAKAVAVDTNNEVLIACEESNKIIVCDFEGKHLRSFGSRKKSKTIRNLSNVAVDGKGLVAVMSRCGPDVHVFERNGGHTERFRLRPPSSLLLNDVVLLSNTHVNTAGHMPELFAGNRSSFVEVRCLFCSTPHQLINC